MQYANHEDLYRGCNGAKAKVSSKTDLGRVELIVKGLESKKHFHNYCQNNNFTPQLSIKQQTSQKPQMRN